MQIETSLTGPFPRPEALVAATRDLDRGRTGAAEVDALRRRTEEEILALERRLGFSPVTGGFLGWPDLFRPLAETWRGFTVGPLTRWFETNTFFRQPVLHHPPERVPGAFAALLPAAPRGSGLPTKALLPGPYTFAGLLDNRSGETREALVHRLGRLLAEETAELVAAGYAEVEFPEPLLVVRPPEGPRAESVLAAYRAIAEGAGAARTSVWTYFADATPSLKLLGRLPVTSVGIDLSETEPESLRALPERRALGLGVLDPRTSLAEDPREVARIVRELESKLSPPRIVLGPGGPLDLLPYGTAVGKLESLAAARQLLAPGAVA